MQTSPYPEYLVQLDFDHDFILSMIEGVHDQPIFIKETDLPYFDKLLDCINQHLRREECLMRSLNYHDLSIHMEQHLELQIYFAETIRPMLRQPNQLPMAMDLIKSKINEHIRNEGHTFLIYAKDKWEKEQFYP